jgi:glyoxylase-like metal-dependent hydrolase (beta-lactamase superfamily II)
MQHRLVSILLAALCAALPVSAQPGGHLLSAAGLARVSDHVWMIKGFPNIGIVVGTRGTLVVDDGLGTRNGQVIAAVARQLSTRGQKLYLTTTHYHAEHATGDGGFPASVTLLRPRVQQAELEAEGQKLIDTFSGRSAEDKALLQGFQYHKPDILFDNDYRLDLGGVTAELSWFGAAHTKGDMLTMVEPDGVLISGDVVQNKAGPYLYCATCTVKSWLAVLDHITALGPKIVIPDHSPMGDGTLVAQEREMLAYVQSRTLTLKAEGKSADAAGKIVAAEFPVRYPGWTNLTHVAEAVARIYDNP